MAERKYTGTGGLLYPNENKATDNHPDYRGTITIDEQEYWVSGWAKEGKRGPFISLAINKKEDKPKENAATVQPHRARVARTPAARPSTPDLPDDEIPF